MPTRGIGIGAEDIEALSGSFATVLTAQPSMEHFSGSLCALSVNEDDSMLTVVPVVGSNVALSATPADQQGLSAASNSSRRLFFAQASSDATEEQIKQWFSQYGVVESVQLLNDSSSGHSSGCGYITMGTSEQAAAALAAIQQNQQLPSPVGFLNVSYPLADELASAAAPSAASQMSSLVANADRTIFFAKVPPTALASEVELLFGSFGKLAEVNLFRAWAGAKHSKGCGLITYVDRQCANVAIAQLHGKYVFPGSDCPMVVEWMDLRKQRPVAPPPPADKPPLGCAHDAYKLLLSNVPLTVTEADLAAVLRQYGHVVQLSLTPDNSGASASGHVWYATKQAADALQNRVKTEPLWLRDARTNQDLALSVKRSRKPGVAGSHGGPTRQSSTTPNGVAISSSSNSSSGMLPLVQLGGLGSGEVGMQLAQMQRLSAAQSGMDVSMLGSEVIRLLPVQQVSGPLPPQVVPAGGYMATDVCEAMLDVYEQSNMGLGMPVHLQPSIAAQLANNMAYQRASQQQRATNSQMCVLTNGMRQTSGQHCMSSPANIVTGLNEFEGSFNMSLSRGNSMSNVQPSAQQMSQQMAMGQQQLVQQQNGSLVWQQQQQQRPQPQMLQMSQPLQQMVQMQPQQPRQPQQQQQQQVLVVPHTAAMVSQTGQVQLMSQQLQQLQQQNERTSSEGGGAVGNGNIKSIAVPIEAYEVHLVAENLMLLSARSGAQVTISSLPGATLAIMISGRPDQVATAQSLLATVRNRS